MKEKIQEEVKKLKEEIALRKRSTAAEERSTCCGSRSIDSGSFQLFSYLLISFIHLLITSLASLGNQESLNSDGHSQQVLSESSPPLLTRMALQGPRLEPSLDWQANSQSAALYSNELAPDPPSAILLPRPQAVGSPGHPSPSPGIGMGNGDGSSSDSLNRHAIGQEDRDDDDEDSSEYENLVSEQFQLPHLTEPLGRPATLWPDGDAHSSSGSS